MARVRVEFDVDNDAFRWADGSLRSDSVEAVLRQAAVKLADASALWPGESAEGRLSDWNGNTVGTWALEAE